ncbi:MAG: diguanylate cyclase [Candidatus Wallbacteria bacterium]|nr:diguanylate cyclase [Candidatus Wallbacteria bacterium]
MKVLYPFNRIWAKLSLLLVLITFLPLSILGYMAITIQQTQVTNQVRGMNYGFSRLIAFQIYSIMRNARGVFDTMAYSRDIASVDQARIEPILGNFLQNNPIFEGVSVYGQNKRLVAQAGRQLPLEDTTTLFTTAALDRYGGTLIAKADDAQFKLVLYDDRGLIKGAMIAVLNLKLLARTLNEILSLLTQAYANLHIYVLDSDYHVIAASQDAPFVEGNLFTTWSDDPQVAHRFEMSLKDLPGYSYETPPWRIVNIAKPGAVVTLVKIQEKVVQIGMLTGLVALLFGVFFGRTFITRPIGRLVNAANHIAQGDLSRPVPFVGQDEVGELADAFEKMRANLKRMQADLKEKYDEVQTLYGVAKDISLTLNFNDLLDVILDRAMKIVMAERGSIMLLDDDTQELKIEVARGVSSEVVSGTRVKLGEAVSGHVLQSGRPMLIADTLKSPNFSKLKEGKIAAGTMLSVPLIAKDKRLGVLNVSKATPYTLDERDQELFMGLANQAAVAIENARLYTLAITDELTKIYIRRFFYQRLSEELRRARRYKGSCTVIILDIDHFKKFNDTYGHPQGDQVLIHVARTLKSCMRKVDIVARLGGEEFAVVCPEQNVEAALVPAERIRRTIEGAMLDLSGVKVNVTVSIGLADFPNHAQNQADVIDRADQALYHAKHTGRNRVCSYDQVLAAAAAPPKAEDPEQTN